jgi:carboxyl-terminal processing protease
VRQLVAGKIAGFENFKVEKQSYATAVNPGDFQITDKLVDAFRVFAVNDSKSGLTAENIASQVDYSKTRLRMEIATANYSNEAGVQVLLENDPQVAKAMETIPDAARARQTVAYSRTGK